MLATSANAERNGVRVEAIECAWGSPAAIVARAPWDLVIGSDLLYEARNAELLLQLLPRLVDERGLVLLADPGRTAAGAFLERAPDAGWTVRSTQSPRSARVTIHRLRLAAEAAPQLRGSAASPA